jgi:glutaredoxin
VKEFLSRAGREFEDRNVDENESAYDELLARRFRTIPVTFIGDRAITGFDPVALAEALDELDRR